VVILLLEKGEGLGRLWAGLVPDVWVLLLLVAVFGVALNVPVVMGKALFKRADVNGFRGYSDALLPPDLPSATSLYTANSPSSTPGYLETSEYLIGKVAVGVVFLESNGSIDIETEDWTLNEESNVVNEISVGLNWLKSQKPNAGISFNLDVHYRVPTNYEPINHPHTDAGLWVAEAMAYLGYSGSYHFTQVRDYINSLRTSLDTDWAFAIFVVDSYNDPDGCFTDQIDPTRKWSAFAYLGGPFLVMTYDNDGYGIGNMDYVTAHETCHIFYATDEYNGVTETCGYLGVQDLEGSGCMMERANTWWLCTNSKEQLGWRDSDDDDIHDIVDTFPNTELNPYSPDPTSSIALTYVGTVTEVPYPNNNPYGTGRDITINTITGVQFRIDSGTWINANATDGIFDEATEDFTFTTSALSSGTHVIETSGTNSVGNMETSYSSDTITVDYTPPTTFHNYDGVWHTQDFTITLTATDDMSGVAQIYFKINNGPTRTVSLDGQPFITEEGANNTIEYWSIDHADNQELPHKILTGIKLDQTTPSGSILINDGDTYTTSISVTLTLTATDATSGIYQVRYSNDGIWDTEPWEAFSSSRTCTLTSGDGTKTVYYQIKDNVGLFSVTYSDNTILDTAKPTANAGLDQTVNEDRLITLDGSASQDENGIHSYTWTFTDATPQILTGKNPTYTFTTPGTYAITLKVTDTAGNTATDTVIITVPDITRPTANAGSDQTLNEDTLVTFDASGSSDNVGIVSYKWTFTDAGTPQTLDGINPTYTFQTPRTYMVSLNVTDAAGNWATDTVVITVMDVTKPAANAGQSQTVNVGATVTFDAGGSTDDVGIVSYEWDFRDGTIGTNKTTTHTYANPGTYTVRLTVKDAAGNTDIDSITITVFPTEAPPPEAFPMWIVGVAIATIAIAIAAIAIFWRKRKHPPTK
jgi:PKD repeat protein